MFWKIRWASYQYKKSWMPKQELWNWEKRGKGYFSSVFHFLLETKINWRLFLHVLVPWGSISIPRSHGCPLCQKLCPSHHKLLNKNGCTALWYRWRIHCFFSLPFSSTYSGSGSSLSTLGPDTPSPSHVLHQGVPRPAKIQSFHVS